MPRSRLELELLIGDANGLVPNADLRKVLIEWALSCGLVGRTAFNMTIAQLLNVYNDPPPHIPPTPQQLEAAKLLFEKLTAPPLGKLEHSATKEVIAVAALGHPIMLVGPAGSGKTSIGKAVSEALKLPFFITSTVFDTHELMGFVDGYGKYHSTPFRQAYQNGGVWIADEIDAWEASVLLAANSALANGYASFPDDPSPVVRHADFRMIATANTFGRGADRLYIGRSELDAASLDRMAVIEVDYDPRLERMFAAGNAEWYSRVISIRRDVERHKIRHVVSSRAIIYGVAALAAGMPRHRVEEIYVLKGMSDNDRSKIR